MTSREITKYRVLELLDDARTLVELYDIENKRNPRQRFDYASVDAVALRLFEREENCIVTGIQSGRDNFLYIQARVGKIGKDWINGGSGDVSYVIKDMRGTTVATFLYGLCDVIERRKSDQRLSSILSPDISQTIPRARTLLRPYIHV